MRQIVYVFLLKLVSQQAVLTRRLIESVGQTRVGKTAGNLLLWSRLPTFALLLTPLIGVFAVEFVSLGPRFRFLFFAVPLLSIAVTILAALIPSRNSKPKFIVAVENWCGKDQHNGHIGHWKWRCLALWVLAFILFIGLAAIPSSIERISRTYYANAALLSFAPVYESESERNRLERTLAEFEHARRNLGKEWSVPAGTPPIMLHLFQDIGEYRKSTGSNWSSGFAMCQEDAVIIGVPLEEASNLLNEDPHSGTPMHEMVHGMMCQFLGHTSYTSIPSWFHEGVAQFYGNLEASRIADRVLNRITVWLDRENLLESEVFCVQRVNGPRSKVVIFYRTSWEFVRSLEAEYGRHTINAVIDDMSNGVRFDASLTSLLGRTCTVLYEEWAQSL